MTRHMAMEEVLQAISDGRTIEGVERLGLFLFNKAGMALQQPGATVPAQDRIVVPPGTNHLSFREVMHRLRK